MFVSKKKDTLQALKESKKKFREKNCRFVVTEFVKTCDEFVTDQATWPCLMASSLRWKTMIPRRSRKLTSTPFETQVNHACPNGAWVYNLYISFSDSESGVDSERNVFFSTICNPHMYIGMHNRYIQRYLEAKIYQKKVTLFDLIHLCLVHSFFVFRSNWPKS